MGLLGWVEEAIDKADYGGRVGKTLGKRGSGGEIGKDRGGEVRGGFEGVGESGTGGKGADGGDGEGASVGFGRGDVHREEEGSEGEEVRRRAPGCQSGVAVGSHVVLTMLASEIFCEEAQSHIYPWDDHAQ